MSGTAGEEGKKGNVEQSEGVENKRWLMGALCTQLTEIGRMERK